MLVAFVESIKYVGHLIPIAFLRVFLGYFYFNQALLKAQGNFLSDAYLNEEIRNHLPQSTAPLWYKNFLMDVVILNWQFFAIGITALYFAIGISYIAGYMVRPFALLAIALTIGLSAAVGPSPSEAQTTLLIVVHLMLGWLGAGRCLGVDYYFYKRRRGIWW
jgi:thiosulfate dehydrogenase [quinone] large subunit